MTVENEENALVAAVGELTHETTTLLQAYRDAKGNLDANVTGAANSAKAAAAKAGEAATSAQEAKASASKAEAEQVEATKQAQLAKDHADRAEQVTGMDTAQQLVDLAVTEAFVPVQEQIDNVAADTKLPIVHAPLDNKLSLHAGIGDPVFVKSSDKTITVPAQNITVGAETVTIPAQDIVVEGQEIEVPDAQQVKFSRASKAWLDGKEYGVDEPRYTKDGRLLVEGQSTNENRGGSDRAWAGALEFIYYNGIRMSGGFHEYSGVPHCASYGYDGKNLYTVSLFIKRGKSSQLSLYISSRDGYATVNFDAVDQSSYLWKWEYLSDGVYRIWRKTTVPINYQTNIHVEKADTKGAYFGGIQVEEGDTPTSYIPTNGTAVTRAADVALINGQNIVTRWENDQQPISTDTPRLLTNGEHDLSADRLVRFERDTSAWLDGVEYAAGEPRYKDGKLLVEGQATNLSPTSNSLFSRIDNGLITDNIIHTGDAAAHPYNGLALFGATGTANSILQLGTYIFSADVEFLPTSEEGAYLNLRVDGIQGLHHKRVTTSGRYSIIVNTRIAGEYSLYMGSDFTGVIDAKVTNLQIEKGDTATSYIPTTGTTVTRAADFAHVISKQAINTPTGLLPTGEHSVEPTAIRSFKRDTVAWLDGVEYPANTPRYLPNGKLLIEGQSTNLATGRMSPQLSEQASFVLSADGVYTVTTLTHYLKFQHIMSCPSNSTISVGFDVRFPTGANFEVTSSFVSGTEGSIEVVTSYVGTGDWQRVVAENSFSGYGSTAFVSTYPAIKVNRQPNLVFEVKNSQLEVGPTATSYIPTNGTAVTRAADECFVDYQLPPNTYRDLKGFKA